ncbi:hypothetical protein DAPPUDRAFT_257796 [Daphnia pulex]|uniref:Uncharacterized protein n=1 Tax=Daphnia pulex TaxID=6669 RepID=E9HE83_DAPPU|nr:hypothetical protein DAPPUDRAFT_257796 [Daphnia pulex]|eukprot:EFX69972.1 hypothetical protein DAPPUDRAFT_257796 [Daphnia pulex]
MSNTHHECTADFTSEIGTRWTSIGHPSMTIRDHPLSGSKYTIHRISVANAKRTNRKWTVGYPMDVLWTMSPCWTASLLLLFCDRIAFVLFLLELLPSYSPVCIFEVPVLLNICPTGFSAVHSARLGGRRGGGVALIYRESYRTHVVSFGYTAT